ncbi:hypothetical protein M378DRAFT_167080 [Amanita muscaria Koide BX008]|uniref:Uncharacterized protein n=1 Tax=Amanita muscaria (strain Koide BX008) TaxID=946122 RepID=A0A0C2WID4_AMAMK|nr:hypothetical protein M378DRAFT_167080 [Amanita muscaria Koide BX008]
MNTKTEHGPEQLAGGNIFQHKHGMTRIWPLFKLCGSQCADRHSLSRTKKTASSTVMQLHCLSS